MRLIFGILILRLLRNPGGVVNCQMTIDQDKRLKTIEGIYLKIVRKKDNRK